MNSLHARARRFALSECRVLFEIAPKFHFIARFHATARNAERSADVCWAVTTIVKPRTTNPTDLLGERCGAFAWDSSISAIHPQISRPRVYRIVNPAVQCDSADEEEQCSRATYLSKSSELVSAKNCSVICHAAHTRLSVLSCRPKS